MKFKILIILLVAHFSFMAQDTIFVYDTIFIYDTITIYDTIKVEKNESLKRFQKVSIINDSTYLKNNDTLSATILKNSIIVDETIKKIEAMKKINLIGVLFIALQNITFAQHDVGFTFGINGFGTTDNIKEVTNPFAAGLKTGLFYIHNFNEKLGLEIGLNYLYNLNNNSARTSSIDSNLINFRNRFNNDTDEEIRNFNLTKYHSQIAVPVLLNFNLNKISPFVGLEYRYKTYRKTIVYESFIHDIGLKAGLKYSFNEKLGLSLCYYQGLNREGEINLIKNNEVIDSKLKSYSLSLSAFLKL